MTAAELVADPGGQPGGGLRGGAATSSQIGFLHRERERGSRRDVYVVDDDAWLQAMMRKDQTYAPMVAALGTTRCGGLADGAPAAHRLWLMREFLAFVDEEMDGLAERWLARRAELEDGDAAA